VASFSPNFSVVPVEGYISPNQDVKLEIVFHPTTVDPDVRAERLVCAIDGGGDLYVTLTGSCIAAEQESDIISFRCAVRSTVISCITLKNPSSNVWTIKPVINNDYWDGPEVLEIPAGGSVECNLTFRPLEMRNEKNPHKGTVFFPLPTGEGMLYALSGVADTPPPAGLIEFTVPAKQSHVEVIKVKNWLPRPQRFRANVSLEGGEDPTNTMRGSDYLDLPALAEREYRLHCYSYTEGTVTGTVTFTAMFTSEETESEYLFYNLKMHCSAPGVVGVLPLLAAVRQRTTTRIVIENPLSETVTLSTRCNHSQVFVPEEMEVKAKASAELEVAFRPVLVANTEATLILECAALGRYEYKLQLRATPTGPERALSFSAPLGAREVLQFSFTHFSTAKAEYSVRFANNSAEPFLCEEPHVVAHPAGAEGIEQQVDIIFEPTRLGDNFRDTLIVSSPEGGDYECPLVGRCVAPKPKGPFLLNSGTGTVSFKNMFSKETEFTVTTDNPAFTVNNRIEKIPSKRTVNIGVNYKAASGHDYQGKLIITCVEVNVKWIFYLTAERTA